MRNAGLEEAQAGIKIAGRNINNLRYSDDRHIYYFGQEYIRRNGRTLMVNKRVQNAVFECNLKNDSVFRLYQMVNTEIRLIMFFVAKDGETLYRE